MLILLEVLLLLNFVCLLIFKDHTLRRASSFITNLLLFTIFSLFSFCDHFTSHHFLLKLNTPVAVFTPLFTIDRLNSLFALLVTLLFIACLIYDWTRPIYNERLFLILLWCVEFAVLHVFTTQHLLIFYFFFEFSLLPIFFIIFFWGSRQRRTHASLLFFFFTVFGSSLLLLGLLVLYQSTKTFHLLVLSTLELDFKLQLVIWLLFFFGFITKIPAFPAHIWLPEAHVEAPTTGSVLLAGIMLKIGTLGLLKFLFPLLNDASNFFSPLAILLALVSIFHAAVISLQQTDFKKIIAYSSISHMGFVLLGLFSMNFFGLFGGILTMFIHGLVSSAFFLLVGVIYDRYKCRNILVMGGLAELMPLFSIALFLLTLANLALPGTANFISELFVLGGAVQYSLVVGLIAGFSMILTAAYSIWLFNRLSFGTTKGLIQFSDLTKHELYSLVLFLVPVFILGFNPNYFFGLLVPDLTFYSS